MSDSGKKEKQIYEVRLCHVVKRADFDGYGFNLHAEKGRPGQYIGKVDEGSPAESAGLRQGDRIIEVNGINIGTETHKQVVERIKSVPNETKLLVIDPRADLNDAQQIANIEKSKNTIQTNNNINNNIENDSKKEIPKDEMDSKAPMSIMAETKTPEVTPKDPSNITNNNQSANNSMNSNNSNENHSPKMENGSNGAANNNSPANKEKSLNLQLSAAEFRAQLKSKKKYDPKNDTVDLRKKYEMIQKM